MSAVRHTFFCIDGHTAGNPVRLVAGGAPITSFGVGTSLTTSSDAPHLDAVYKLQEYAGQARRKRSKRRVAVPPAFLFAHPVHRWLPQLPALDHDAS